MAEHTRAQKADVLAVAELTDDTRAAAMLRAYADLLEKIETVGHPQWCTAMGVVDMLKTEVAAKDTEIARLKGDLAGCKKMCDEAYEVARKDLDALADERRKVHHLREWAKARSDWPVFGELLLAKLDVLGLTGEEPAPATPAEEPRP